MTTLPFNDLRAEYLAVKHEIDAAVARVLDSGWYILGKEVTKFEEEFAAYLSDDGGEPTRAFAGVQSKIQNPKPKIACVAVNSGTDALHLALRACDVGPGDEVITVSHTAVATAAAIRLTGATPVFVDIDPVTYTMAPAALTAAITERTKAIIPVHLYGHPAAMREILDIARQHGVRVIEDCAQAHGARYSGERVGTLGDLGCFSFYPTKNLGALGDGGAVVSRNPALIDRVRRLREYGWTPQARYISQEEGLNSRLDELQAAILRVKIGLSGAME
jgi:dTDP-3-amino-3,4,6-trideoxy-alpha-D-glucose transaminase